MLNRFTTDIDQVDSSVDGSLNMCLEGVLRTFTTLSLACWVLPSFVVPVALVATQYLKLGNYFRRSVREVKRLQSTTRSPAFAHFSDTLVGQTTIRAFGDEGRFMQTHIELWEEHSRAWSVMQGTQRWLMVRMASFGAVLTAFVAIYSAVFRSTLTPALVGLCMSQAVAVSESLNRLTRMSVELEATMTHTERVLEYGQLPVEAAAVLPSDPRVFPTTGKLAFENVSARYRPGLPLVLNALSFAVSSGEHVGLCGRTGSGKSSIANALFGMMQVERGRVVIDGIDASRLGVATLRRAMAIIPQDPILFISSLRSNLDPERRHSVDRLWEAMEQVQLAAWLREKHKQRLGSGRVQDEDGGDDGTDQDGGLGLQLREGGGNLSVGQRQLICLARALLRAPQILLLDEATASVDYETDRAIQDCITTQFQSCTTLTIAHRLETLMASDKVLVLDAGRLVEAGPPATLRRNAGAFADMLGGSPAAR